MKHIVALGLLLVFHWIIGEAVAQQIVEYTIGTANSGSTNLVTGPDDALWFGETAANKIGRITTAGKITEFPIPSSNSSPSEPAVGSDGALWFGESAANKIGRITTDGEITEFAIPTENSYPSHLIEGPDGALWFSEYNNNKIARITTSGLVNEYPVPNAGTSFVAALTVGPDAAIWFVEPYGSNVGRITTSGIVTEFPVTGNQSAKAITVGPDGAMWFTTANGNIGRITISGQMTIFSNPVGLTLSGITAGPDGALWVGHALEDMIGRMTTDGAFTTFSFQAGPGVLGTSSPFTGPDNLVWFSAFGAVGRIATSGDITLFETPTNTYVGQPSVGPDAAIWFNESVANNIGRLAVGFLTSFPLHDPNTGQPYTPYTVPIISVFDHAMANKTGTFQLYQCDGEVLAFTGDAGFAAYGSFGNYQGDTNCRHQPAYKNSTGTAFTLGGTANYQGAGANLGGPYYLNYDGHPGYDFATLNSSGTVATGQPVFAATPGVIFYPARVVGQSFFDAYCRFHDLAIQPDSAPGTYRNYYLHLSTHPNGLAGNPDNHPTLCQDNANHLGKSHNVPGASAPFTGSATAPNGQSCFTQNRQAFTPATLPLPSGTHVEAGCEIALSGDAGVPGNPHLHFEVQTILAVSAGLPNCFLDGPTGSYKKDAVHTCVPVDPYGWQGPQTDCSGSPSTWTGDIYECLTGTPSVKLWAQ